MPNQGLHGVKILCGFERTLVGLGWRRDHISREGHSLARTFTPCLDERRRRRDATIRKAGECVVYN